MISLKTVSIVCVFWKDEALFVRIKSISNLRFLVKQVSVFTELVKVNRQQSSFNFSKFIPLVLISILSSFDSGYMQLYLIFRNLFSLKNLGCKCYLFLKLIIFFTELPIINFFKFIFNGELLEINLSILIKVSTILR